MFEHHTKTKGDYGVLKAKLSLFENGFLICNPETEHAPFDLVAYKNGKFIRVQVKYITAKDGKIFFTPRTSYSDSKGSYSNVYNKADIDYFIIYCPSTDKCYYIRAIDAFCETSFTLRLVPPKNNQTKGINYAKDYKNI